MSTAEPTGEVPPLPEGRRAVLYAVRRRGDATAEQVAEQLGITASGARQHLSALADAGLVGASELDPEEPKRGRRALLYAVTPKADALFPKAYAELTNELLSYVVDTDPEMLEAIFVKRRERRIASAHQRIQPKANLAEKVAELAHILDEDGYMATTEFVEPDVYLVVEHNCAIWAVAQQYGQACSSELDFIRAVLPEARVERVQHMVAGARHCAYEIRAHEIRA
jgi:DeoR family transcriptional regulator, suf operon transcriptional repressor